MGFLLTFIALAIIIFSLITGWKVFTKAGLPGWGFVVPIYNLYCLCKIAARPAWWVILLLLPPISIVISLILAFDIARNFGQGRGFAVGLILVPFIFFPVLAFGSAIYLGNGEQEPGGSASEPVAGPVAPVALSEPSP